MPALNIIKCTQYYWILGVLWCTRFERLNEILVKI